MRSDALLYEDEMAMGMTMMGWHGMLRWRVLRRLAAMTVRREADGVPARGGDIPTTRTGDFEDFFRRHEPRITGYLWRMVGDEGTASDLCQETFIRAWGHFAEVGAAAQPLAWLFRVATNLALNHLRAQSRGVRTAISLDAAADPASSDPTGHFIERDFVGSVLAELAPKSRAILILRDVYGVSFDEAGAMLGLSPTAARMALSRARAQFRDRYLQQERG
jgi:RNA polymerase sigma-70 factor, ECF subfamily